MQTDNKTEQCLVVELPVKGYSKLSGYKLVAFEELYLLKKTPDKDGKEKISEYKVAEHKDKTDKNQTVKIPGTKTGDTSKLYIFGGLFLAILAVGIATIFRRKRLQ